MNVILPIDVLLGKGYTSKIIFWCLPEWWI